MGGFRSLGLWVFGLGLGIRDVESAAFLVVLRLGAAAGGLS